MMERRSSLAFDVIALGRFAVMLWRQSLALTKGLSNLMFMWYYEEPMWRKDVDHCEIFNSELSLWNWNGNWKGCIISHHRHQPVWCFQEEQTNTHAVTPCLWRVIRLNEPKIQLRLKGCSTATFGLLRNHFCSHSTNYPHCKSKAAQTKVWKGLPVLTYWLSLCALPRTDCA